MDKYILKKYIPNKSNIIDAGAFNGNDSIDFAVFFPESTIYAFEPVLGIYNTLANNTKHYKNIKTFNLALDDVVGNKTMFISSGYSQQSSSLLKPKEHLEVFPTCAFQHEEIVQTTTINQFVKDNNIPTIDFMWLDLQGNEYKVLSKADEIIHTTKGIFAEYSLVEFYEGLMLYNDFKVFMKKLGFKEILNDNQFNHLKCGNSLFIKEELI